MASTFFCTIFHHRMQYPFQKKKKRSHLQKKERTGWVRITETQFIPGDLKKQVIISVITIGIH